MADALVKHAFVSAIPEGTDPTKIRPSNWNAALLFSAGNAGEALTRDTGSATGAAWSALTKNSVGLGNVENTALSTWAGSANLTTVGPLTLSASLTTSPVKHRIGADLSLVNVPSDLGGNSEVTTNAMLYLANTFDSGAIFIDQIGTGTAGAGLVTRHAQGTAAAPTDVVTNLQLGYMDFRAYSGTKFWQCASIAAHVDGTFTTGQAPPSRLIFATNVANGGSTERMRLDRQGNLLINTTAVLLSSTNSPLQVKGTANEWTVMIAASPASGAGYGLRLHTTPVTASDYAVAISAGAGTGSFVFSVNGLGNVNIGALTGNANAILDVQSTTKAFMPPRMTTTQRDAVASPTAGMVVYNSTTGKLNVRGAAAWEAVTSA